MNNVGERERRRRRENGKGRRRENGRGRKRRKRRERSVNEKSERRERGRRGRRRKRRRLGKKRSGGVKTNIKVRNTGATRNRRPRRVKASVGAKMTVHINLGMKKAVGGVKRRESERVEGRNPT